MHVRCLVSKLGRGQLARVRKRARQTAREPWERSLLAKSPAGQPSRRCLLSTGDLQARWRGGSHRISTKGTDGALLCSTLPPAPPASSSFAPVILDFERPPRLVWLNGRSATA